MPEILCHPWVTYTEFPKYIDHKLTENKSSRFRKKNKNPVTSFFQTIKHQNFETSITNEFQLQNALENNINSSFVVGFKIGQAEALEKQRKDKMEKKKLENQMLLELGLTPKTFSFTLLNDIFSNEIEAKKFQQTFFQYTVQNHQCRIAQPWRTGYNFSINLKKLFKNLCFAANKVKVKITVIKNEDYYFRFNLLDSLGGLSEYSFTLQIYDNFGEYVFDFRNETVPKLRFLLICINLFRQSKF